MDAQSNQSNLYNPQLTDIWQKFKNKKFITIILGVILIVFLAIVSFTPEKHLEEKLSSTPPPATPTIRAPRVEDQVILKFKKEVNEEQINERLKQYNATIVKRIYGSDLILINVPKGQGDVMLDAFKKDSLIEQAQPNYIYKTTTNDSSYNLQWGLKNTGQTIKNKKGTANNDINAEAAWAVTKGDGVKIAILDTGIDINHPDLSSKIVAQQDFTGQGIDDGRGHGTHVAGIAAAVTDNTTGIAGTCPQCQLVIVKTLGNNATGNTADVVSAINWAADPNQGGAKVISMSFAGSETDSATQQAINDAWAKGVVIVAAASNEGDATKKYPGAYQNVVSVAATDNNDQLASFSTYGTWVTVAAPGVNIYSTLPTHSYGMQTGKDDENLQLNYDYLTGTSQATPIVAGVVGLIWATSYGTSNADVVKRLCDTADKITGTGTVTGSYWVCGRVNAGNAVAAALALPAAPGNPGVTVTPMSTPVPSNASSTTPCCPPSFGCIYNNPCALTSTQAPTSISSIPNKSPTLSTPVTSTQPITSIQPNNPLPYVAEPSQPKNPHHHSAAGLVKVFLCFFLPLILISFGIDLNSLGINLISICSSI